MRQVFVVVAFCLAGCASFDASKPAVDVVRVSVTSDDVDSTLPALREALRRAVAADGRFALAEGDAALAAPLAGRLEVTAGAAPGLVHVVYRVLDAEGRAWVSLETDLSADRSLWAWSLTRRWAPVPDVQALFASPRGTPADEALRQARVLAAVRVGASADLALQPALRAAFQTRWGRTLDQALESPAMVFVPGGTFAMGHEQAEKDESPVHLVTVGPVLMGATEVTQALYTSVMGTNPSLFTQAVDAPRRPVERVSWLDAVEFCNRLSAREGLEPVYGIRGSDVTSDPTRSGYRLPTEAEWEWAARGASGAPVPTFAGSDDPRLVAWTKGEGGPAPVGERQPNTLGLFDLSGNVWEWCADWYGPYAATPSVNPAGAESGILRVGRGGSWHAAPWMARVTSRSFDNPTSRSSSVGFRVVRSLINLSTGQ